MLHDPRHVERSGAPHVDRPLERTDLADDPVQQFRRWFDEAVVAAVPLPNAMGLATADADGRPSVRHVLLRGVDERGFVFFTNRESRKGREIAANPRAALVILWKALDRQVTATGDVEPTTDEESDAYFSERPRDAQIGAWASAQSEPLADRVALEARITETNQRFAGQDVPRPPHWGGYRIIPITIEFWQGRSHRLHDRFRYARSSLEDPWVIERLSP